MPVSGTAANASPAWFVVVAGDAEALQQPSADGGCFHATGGAARADAAGAAGSVGRYRPGTCAASAPLRPILLPGPMASPATALASAAAGQRLGSCLGAPSWWADLAATAACEER